MKETKQTIKINFLTNRTKNDIIVKMRLAK